MKNNDGIMARYSWQKNLRMADGQKLRTGRWLVKTFSSSGMNEVLGV